MILHCCSRNLGPFQLFPPAPLVCQQPSLCYLCLLFYSSSLIPLFPVSGCFPLLSCPLPCLASLHQLGPPVRVSSCSPLLPLTAFCCSVLCFQRAACSAAPTRPCDFLASFHVSLLLHNQAACPARGLRSHWRPPPHSSQVPKLPRQSCLLGPEGNSLRQRLSIQMRGLLQPQVLRNLQMGRRQNRQDLQSPRRPRSDR